MELGYWPSRGVAEPIRYLSAITGEPLKEVIYETPQAWESQKQTLPIDFPNIPYLKDGDFYLTECNAIALYVAHKAGRPELFGKNGTDAAIVRQIQGILEDLRQVYYKLLFGIQKIDVFLDPSG